MGTKNTWAKRTKHNFSTNGKSKVLPVTSCGIGVHLKLEFVPAICSIRPWGAIIRRWLTKTTTCLVECPGSVLKHVLFYISWCAKATLGIYFLLFKVEVEFVSFLVRRDVVCKRWVKLMRVCGNLHEGDFGVVSESYNSSATGFHSQLYLRVWENVLCTCADDCDSDIHFPSGSKACTPTHIHIHTYARVSPSNPPSPWWRALSVGAWKWLAIWTGSVSNSLSISRLQFHCCGSPCSLTCCLISDPHPQPWRPMLSVINPLTAPPTHTHAHAS